MIRLVTRNPWTARRMMEHHHPLRITERAKALVLEVLEHNRLSYGPMTRRAEAEFLEALQPQFRRLLEREADGCRDVAPEIRPPQPSDMAVPR